jgi:hypothetical protein
MPAWGLDELQFAAKNIPALRADPEVVKQRNDDFYGCVRYVLANQQVTFEEFSSDLSGVDASKICRAHEEGVRTTIRHRYVRALVSARAFED